MDVTTLSLMPGSISGKAGVCLMSARISSMARTSVDNETEIVLVRIKGPVTQVL